METEPGEAHKLEEYVDWRKQPVDKSKNGGILATTFVILSEVSENLAFLSNATNIVNYFYGFMHFSLAVSAKTVTKFMGTSCCCFGEICDTFTTTYVTVIVYAILKLLCWCHYSHLPLAGLGSSPFLAIIKHGLDNTEPRGPRQNLMRYICEQLLLL
ncbi:hypothetical protein SUGI_0481690 [Cryptomeria japonica]|nr:hypothetical protein SUGI_0481690 [Cryptomeria japonica]